MRLLIASLKSWLRWSWVCCCARLATCCASWLWNFRSSGPTPSRGSGDSRTASSPVRRPCRAAPSRQPVGIVDERLGARNPCRPPPDAVSVDCVLASSATKHRPQAGPDLPAVASSATRMCDTFARRTSWGILVLLVHLAQLVLGGFGRVGNVLSAPAATGGVIAGRSACRRDIWASRRATCSWRRPARGASLTVGRASNSASTATEFSNVVSQRQGGVGRTLRRRLPPFC